MKHLYKQYISMCSILCICIIFLYRVIDSVWSNIYEYSTQQFMMSLHSDMLSITDNAPQVIDVDTLIQNQQWSSNFITLWLFILTLICVAFRSILTAMKATIELWQFATLIVIILLISLISFELTHYLKSTPLLLTQLLTAIALMLWFIKPIDNKHLDKM